MEASDPLALRHGPLVGQVWEQIALARRASRNGLTLERAAFWQRRVRHLKRQIMKAHRTEMARPDASTPTIDGWFEPVTQTLSQAEAHFAEVIAAKSLRCTQSAATSH